VCAADFPPDSSCSDDEQCPLPQACVGDDTTDAIGVCATVDTLTAPCDSECYGPFYCSVITVGELGNCIEFPGLGEPCAASGRCAGQLVCSSTYYCVERLPVDSPCTDGEQCELGLICTTDLPNGPSPGQCATPQLNSEVCSWDDQCVSQVCAGTPATCEPYANCYE
jgi:hypothetical protein